MAKRKNKTKKEIVTDIKSNQETIRQRELIRTKLYPFMLELNDTVGFTNIFLQSAAAAIQSAFSNLSKTMKVKELIPHLKEVLKEGSDSEKYFRLFELMQDESISSFSTNLETLPMIIEKYFMFEANKRPVLDVNIDKILG